MMCLFTSVGRGGNKRNGKTAFQIRKKIHMRGGGGVAGGLVGGRKESTVWSYFSCDNDNKIVECLLCQRLFKKPGNTTNLFDHLKRRHFSHWQKLEEGTSGGNDMNSPQTHIFKRTTRPRSIYAKHYKTNVRGSREERKQSGNENISMDGASSPQPPVLQDETAEMTVGVDGDVAAETLHAAQGLAATAARLSIPF